MGINVTQTLGSFQFENQENLRNTAKDILHKQGASEQTIQKIIEKTIFNPDERIYSKSQLEVIKASAQISMNGSLKETLKYLKKHAGDKITTQDISGKFENGTLKLIFPKEKKQNTNSFIEIQ